MSTSLANKLKLTLAYIVPGRKVDRNETIPSVQD